MSWHQTPENAFDFCEKEILINRVVKTVSSSFIVLIFFVLKIRFSKFPEREEKNYNNPPFFWTSGAVGAHINQLTFVDE